MLGVHAKQGKRKAGWTAAHMLRLKMRQKNRILLRSAFKSDPGGKRVFTKKERKGNDIWRMKGEPCRLFTQLLK